MIKGCIVVHMFPANTVTIPTAASCMHSASDYSSNSQSTKIARAGMFESHFGRWQVGEEGAGANRGQMGSFSVALFALRKKHTSIC